MRTYNERSQLYHIPAIPRVLPLSNLVCFSPCLHLPYNSAIQWRITGKTYSRRLTQNQAIGGHTMSYREGKQGIT